MECVEIRVKGCLDESWSAWFAGLTMTYTPAGETILTGPIADQAALYGLLNKLRNLGVALIAVSVQNGRQEETEQVSPGLRN
jgi:hypothetical protein